MKVGIILGIIATSLWGMVFLVPAIGGDFTPIFICFARYVAYGLISAVFMLPFLGSIRGKIKRRDIFTLIKLALTGNIIYYFCVAFAVQHVGVAPTSLIVGLVPVSSLLFSKKDKQSATFKELMGPLILIMLGLIFINADVFTAINSDKSLGHKLAGILSAFVALFSWTWFAADNAYFLKNNSRYTSNEWSALFGFITGVVMFTIGVVLHFLGVPVTTSEISSVMPDTWKTFLLVILCISLGSSFLGNSLWNASSKRLPLTLVSQLIIFETISALIYGFIYYHRLPRILEVLAVVMLISGVLWSIRRHRKVAAKDALANHS